MTQESISIASKLFIKPRTGTEILLLETEVCAFGLEISLRLKIELEAPEKETGSRGSWSLFEGGYKVFNWEHEIFETEEWVPLEPKELRAIEILKGRDVLENLVYQKLEDLDEHFEESRDRDLETLKRDRRDEDCGY